MWERIEIESSFSIYSRVPLLDTDKIRRCKGLQKLWEKYGGYALPPLMFFYQILIKNTALLLLERKLAMAKNINFSLLFLQLPIFLTSKLLMEALQL